MSRENVEVVRQPMVVGAQSRRRLEEHLAVRFPHVLRLFARAGWRLPRHSRLRQALIRRAAELGFEATNRGDYEAAFALYHPHCEMLMPQRFVSVGGVAGTRGTADRARFQREWTDEWGEFRLEPEEILDLGDRLLLIGRMKGSGLRSGAAFNNQWAVLLTISAGRVIREQIFDVHDDALEAAGLRESGG